VDPHCRRRRVVANESLFEGLSVPRKTRTQSASTGVKFLVILVGGRLSGLFRCHKGSRELADLTDQIR
jgi:hypothetical protein